MDRVDKFLDEALKLTFALSMFIAALTGDWSWVGGGTVGMFVGYVLRAQHHG
jgi:hypothetical protein